MMGTNVELMRGNNVELSVKDAARMVAEELKRNPPERRGASVATFARNNPSPIVALSFFVFIGLVSYLVTRSIDSDDARSACFRTCELQTIGREFENPSNYFLVHRCTAHDREHLEPIPERVYFEMRDNGVKELRR